MPSNNVGLRILFGEDYQRWSWVHEQLPYTTPAYIAEKVADLACDFYSNKSNQEPVIWDMFAGLGSDTIYFAKKDFFVYATEISPTIYDLLEKNIEEFQLKDRILPFQSDCVAKLSTISADLVYFDPPWGESFNPEEEFDFTDVKLNNGTGVVDLLKRVHTEKTQNIVIKAPLKCNTFEELDFLSVKRTYIFRKHHVKFLFVSSDSAKLESNKIKET